jgi:hypothetical protein
MVSGDHQIVKIRGPKSPVKIHSQFGTTRTGGYKKKHRFTLWLFNIAMENDPFIDGLPIKKW